MSIESSSDGMLKISAHDRRTSAIGCWFRCGAMLAPNSRTPFGAKTSSRRGAFFVGASARLKCEALQEDEEWSG